MNSVRQIYDHYKSNGIPTVVMGASFRNTAQIKALAGCDNLTIAPKLLEELAGDDSDLPRRLTPAVAGNAPQARVSEASFRWEMNADAMACEKLAEGIRNFHRDHATLIAIVAGRLQ